MTLAQHYRRLRRAWCRYVGDLAAIAELERMEVEMAFEKLQAVVDDATAAFGRYKDAADAAQSAAVSSAVAASEATADDAATAIVQPLADAVAAVAPPAVDPGAPQATQPAP